MRPGDMDQWEIENERAWSGIVKILIGLVAMCAMSTIVGIAIGYMLWGI